MVRRVVAGFAALFAAGLIVLAGASPAAAKVDGGCTGSGAFQNEGITVDASETGVVTVPDADTVNWRGDLPGPPATPTAYSGKIEVSLPPPFSPIKIDSWSGTSDSPGNSGVKKYDLPSGVPGGVEFEVSGNHKQGNVNCSGSVRVKLEGGFTSSPAGPVSAALTLLSGAGVLAAGRPKAGGFA